MGVAVTRVYVGITGPDWGQPGALVRYTVTYADGTHLTLEDELDANQTEAYYLGHIQLTCWGSFDILYLYSHVLPPSRVPSGVRYSVRTPGNIDDRCHS